MEQEVKIYYLPPYRSIVIGSIFLLMGLAFTFGMIDYQQSFWKNLQFVLISFEGIVEFMFSLIMLLFKAAFFVGGYLYIKYSNGVERARLDSKGFYYREIPKGNKYEKVAMDAGKLTFAAYSSIQDISCEKKFWSGWQLYLTLDSGKLPLTALGVLKLDEKKEIVDLIKQQIQRSKKGSVQKSR